MDVVGPVLSFFALPVVKGFFTQYSAAKALDSGIDAIKKNFFEHTFNEQLANTLESAYQETCKILGWQYIKGSFTNSMAVHQVNKQLLTCEQLQEVLSKAADRPIHEEASKIWIYQFHIAVAKNQLVHNAYMSLGNSEYHSQILLELKAIREMIEDQQQKTAKNVPITNEPVGTPFIWKPNEPIKNKNATKPIHRYPRDFRLVMARDKSKHIDGFVEGEACFVQQLQLFLATESYKYPIYSDDYGIEQAVTIYETKDIIEFQRQCECIAERIISSEFQEYIQKIYTITRIEDYLQIELKVNGRPDTLLINAYKDPKFDLSSSLFGETTEFPPVLEPKYRIGDTIIFSETTIKIIRTYTTTVVVQPNGSGFQANNGHVFFAIEFEVSTSTNPTSGRYWYPNCFISHIVSPDQTKHECPSSFGDNNEVYPNQTYTKTVYIQIVSSEVISEICVKGSKNELGYVIL